MHDRLYRSRDERVVFGVCGGLADQLDIDPSLVRIVFALLVLAGGIGFALYIIMAIVVPEEPDDAARPVAPVTDAAAPAPAGGEMGGVTGGTGGGAASTLGASAGATWATERAARREARRAARRLARSSHDGRGAVVFGAILVLVGAWFLVRRYIPALDQDFMGPIVLIVIGALLVGGALRRTSDEGPRHPR